MNMLELLDLQDYESVIQTDEYINLCSKTDDELYAMSQFFAQAKPKTKEQSIRVARKQFLITQIMMMRY
jgi:uncharacterized membrane protein